MAKSVPAKGKASKSKGWLLFRKALWGAALGVILTLAAILLFALILKAAELGENIIKPVNQVIKILAILLASYATFRRCDEQRNIACMLSGALYIIGGFLIFSAIEWTFAPTLGLLSDAVMAVVIALIFSICLNLLQKPKKAHLSKSS